jgi:uncharacterized membrane protein YcaP (DUF421 family)
LQTSLGISRVQCLIRLFHISTNLWKGQKDHKEQKIKELFTEDELMGQFLEQGMEDPARVKEAYMESDGRFSVVQKKERQQPKKERKSK